MAVSDQRVAPLTFGQLSVWRDVEDLPIDRAHEANLADVWTVPREAARLGAGAASGDRTAPAPARQGAGLL